MILSVLIPTLIGRHWKLNRVMEQIAPQYQPEIEILVDTDNGQLPVGAKRQKLLERAVGDYVVYVDDDDEVAPFYLTKIMDALKAAPDCVGITGEIDQHGKVPRRFVHSLKYKEKGWHEEGDVYCRTPNHLNPIKRELALKAGFNVSKRHGEDREYSEKVLPFLNREIFISDVLYYYHA